MGMPVASCCHRSVHCCSLTLGVSWMRSGVAALAQSSRTGVDCCARTSAPWKRDRLRCTPAPRADNPPSFSNDKVLKGWWQGIGKRFRFDPLRAKRRDGADGAPRAERVPRPVRCAELSLTARDRLRAPSGFSPCLPAEAWGAMRYSRPDWYVPLSGTRRHRRPAGTAIGIPLGYGSLSGSRLAAHLILDCSASSRVSFRNRKQLRNDLCRSLRLRLRTGPSRHSLGPCRRGHVAEAAALRVCCSCLWLPARRVHWSAVPHAQGEYAVYNVIHYCNFVLVLWTALPPFLDGVVSP
mmetsp:Transcript_1073/g.2086  ORF Transcript_1073/g.2086 Transcript_1073/m.2086 type:complete len:295 (-) Transcript_1073:512-1396(-)